MDDANVVTELRSICPQLTWLIARLLVSVACIAFVLTLSSESGDGRSIPGFLALPTALGFAWFGSFLCGLLHRTKVRALMRRLDQR